MAVELKAVENLDFSFKSPIEIEAQTSGRAIIKGVLLSEGISRSGNLYTISEMAHIAESVVDAPIEVGTNWRGKHARSPRVGKIIRAWLDKQARKIFFVAEVWGSIARKVKAGWGVSIDGIAKKAHYVVMESGRIVTKIKGLVVAKVQLFKKGKKLKSGKIVKSGVPSAQVTSVEIQESMEFGKQGLTDQELKAIVSALIATGEIKI